MVVVVGVVVDVVVSGANVVVVKTSGSSGAAKYRTGLLVDKHFPVTGHRKNPVIP